MDQSSSSFLNTFPTKIQDNNHPAAMSFMSPNGMVFAPHHQQQQQQQTPPPPPVIPTSPFGNSHLPSNLPPYHGSPLGLSNVNLGAYNLNQIQQPPPTSLAPQQQPPQPQQWSQNIPTIMPWSNTTNPVVDNNSMAAVGGGGDKFSFASPSTTIINNNNNQSNHHPLASDIYKSSSANCDPLSNAYSSPPPPPSSSLSASPSPSSHNFNNKNKRNFHQLMNECTSNDFEFDFDNSRPIKKYVCEDKVLEIFDRLHIREGEHYIVEDVVENGCGSTTTGGGINTNQHHDLCIEEIDCNTDACIDLSPELIDAFKNNPQNLIDKFIATEQDKINKALVVWKPNDLTKLINGDSAYGDSSTTTDADLDVRIEEALSDDDDHNPQRQQDDIMISEFIGPTTITQIEPYQEFQDQLME